MLTSINGMRRKIRSFYQKMILVSLLLSFSIFIFSYLNLEFCYKILSANSLNHMCILYRENQYSGSLCEEFCTGNSFKDFKCPQNSMKTTVFTAVKNNDVYAIKLAKHIKDDLTWRDKSGNQRYPKINDFQNIVKRYLTIIEDSVIHALLQQEINEQYPEQMMNFWRLFKDNNYMLGKLFDEESIFPNILGSCGPYYATENLNSVQPETGMRHYITIDWIGRLKFSMMILDFLYRLDSIKPEPLKICKIDTNFFGLTEDKRIKYQSAHYIHSEIQTNKILANGKVCESNKDCTYENCLGKCDLKMKICSGPQQNNNLQIVCEHIFKGTILFPGLLATAKAPVSLTTILNICIDPSKNEKNHVENKPFAATADIGIKLYNEIKRIHNTLTFHQ